MNSKVFQNRREAGRLLAEKLAAYANRRDVTVLALPRGGVPVAYEVARALRAPLDVFVVRKLGLPGHEELAMGAVATGGIRVLNQELLDNLRLPPHLIDTVAARELEELKRRERVYRDGRPPPDVRDRTVILLDDGLATGATMQAAIKALRELAPARIVVAVPTAPKDTCRSLRAEADEVICDITPEPFFGVGVWYADFTQTSDDEVRTLLAQSAQAGAPAVPRPSDSADEAVRRAAVELRGTDRDYDPLLERIGDAQFVLLGEASHGTHEFYRERAEITKRLLVEKNFSAVAVEADWPDAYRVNRYVRGASDDFDAAEALSDFRRFPTWMWRNTVVAEFVEWQRAFNQSRSERAGKTGFYGLDLYSLRGSMKAVLQYLDRIDPEAAKRARHRYACFDQFGEDTQTYGFMTSLNLSKSCEEEVVKQLVDLRAQVWDAARRTGRISEDDIFYVEQNARLVKNAEVYYRSMFLKEESTWNLRDRHMMEALEAVCAHLGRDGAPVKMVIWAHNSHLGDARATEMSRRGEINLGQLVRERHGRNAVLVGFTTHHGTVTAASDWDGPPERKHVRPALAGSYEALFHEAHLGRFLLTSQGEVRSHLLKARLERAIGVIYRPATERLSHYFDAKLPEQFDAVLHFDETSAVEPLAINAEWQAGEVPETYPFGV